MARRGASQRRPGEPPIRRFRPGDAHVIYTPRPLELPSFPRNDTDVALEAQVLIPHFLSSRQAYGGHPGFEPMASSGRKRAMGQGHRGRRALGSGSWVRCLVGPLPASPRRPNAPHAHSTSPMPLPPPPCQYRPSQRSRPRSKSPTSIEAPPVTAQLPHAPRANARAPSWPSRLLNLETRQTLISKPSLLKGILI